MFGRDRYFSSSGGWSNFRGWGYQDFAAGVITGTIVTITANENGSDPYGFSASRIISNTAVIVRSDDPSRKVYTGTIPLFSTKIEVASHSLDRVTFNAIPHSSWSCRIYYFYNYELGAPLAYTIPSKAVASGIFTELQDLFVTEEEITTTLGNYIPYSIPEWVYIDGLNQNLDTGQAPAFTGLSLIGNINFTGSRAITNNSPTDISIITGNGSFPTGNIYLTTGNVTSGGTDSGDIVLTTGTTSGNSGSIYLNADVDVNGSLAINSFNGILKGLNGVVGQVIDVISPLNYDDPTGLFLIYDIDNLVVINDELTTIQGIAQTSRPTFANISLTELTPTRIPYVTTNDYLVDSANLTFDGTNLTNAGYGTFTSGLRVGNSTTVPSLSAGLFRVAYTGSDSGSMVGGRIYVESNRNNLTGNTQISGLDQQINWRPSAGSSNRTYTRAYASQNNITIDGTDDDNNNFTITNSDVFKGQIKTVGGSSGLLTHTTATIFQALAPSLSAQGRIGTITAFYDAGQNVANVTNPWGLGINTPNNYINGSLRVGSAVAPTNNLSLPLDGKIDFGDNAVFIFSDDDGHLDLTADTSIDLNASVVMSNKITTYNNTVTEGHGIPAILDNVELTSQTAAIAETEYTNCQAAGLYRISFYYMTTTADAAAGQITFHIKWHDGTAARDVAPVSAISLSSATSGYQATQVARVANGQYLKYYTSLTGTMETAQYAIYTTCEKLS